MVGVVSYMHGCTNILLFLKVRMNNIPDSILLRGVKDVMIYGAIQSWHSMHDFDNSQTLHTSHYKLGGSNNY